MQLPETAETSEANGDTMDENAAARVKRRPFGSALRSRLNNIVSMYVPSTSNGNSQAEAEVDEHTELLSGVDNKPDHSTNKADDLYVIRLVYSGDILAKCISSEAQASSFLSKDESPKAIAIAADSHTIYLCLDGVPYVFLLKTPEADSLEMIDESENQAPADKNPIKGFIRLTIPGVGDLVPQELCVHAPTTETRVLYVVGWILSTNADKSHTSSPTKQWVLAKFSLSGQYLARTRIYPYQRYSGLAVDSTDGKLLLACPTLSSEPSINGNGVKKGAIEISAGQLCKLTPGFERRVFSVTMGNDVAIYRPDYVSQESAGRCCWASVQRNSRVDPTSNNTATKPTVSRRLFAFPGRQLEGVDKRSPREWLHVVSWDFADLNPGRIATFDADRLLVVDATTGTLSYITWRDNCEKPTLHRITRPKSKPINLICTNHHVKASYPPMAYFISGFSLYSFRFNQNLETEA
ncbi:unnamed protein product [Echinostoma caproni]|uniref:DUF5736 domain-containing protein n=1 Tax=Echinostoma caproni TaxID=27848 RepID=A0A183AW89_9TREM|nr:unnamed protein product [Echinostoma caproni]